MTSSETVLNGNSVKRTLYKTPSPYFIVLVRSVKTKEFKIIEFHRTGQMWITIISKKETFQLIFNENSHGCFILIFFNLKKFHRHGGWGSRQQNPRRGWKLQINKHTNTNAGAIRHATSGAWLSRDCPHTNTKCEAFPLLQGQIVAVTRKPARRAAKM